METKKNIIYLCDAEKKASGGAKIIYQHSQIINSFKGYSSEVLHIKLKKSAKWKISLTKKIGLSNSNHHGWQLNQIKALVNFKHNWFHNKIIIKNNFNFNPSKDLVIFPEIYAHLAEDLCIKKNISYGIFVQNGYSINSSSNLKLINNVYNNANFILSYSKDINECIQLNFPNITKKIVNINISINSKKFTFNNKKKNLITYMSRKLPNHSSKVISILKRYLPLKWKIKDLNNISEKEVYRNLNQSKIFLSFSELEGLGIPPLEAALFNNHVIGYIGEGGKDYWKKPIFTKISSGDIKKFVHEIVKRIKNKNFTNKNLAVQRKKIREDYSLKKETISLKKFLRKII